METRNSSVQRPVIPIPAVILCVDDYPDICSDMQASTSRDEKSSYHVSAGLAVTPPTILGQDSSRADYCDF